MTKNHSKMGDAEETNKNNSSAAAEATTEFWSSESDYDVAQIMVRRVLFTIHTWLYRVLVGLGVMTVSTFVVCVPISMALVVMINNIRRVIARKRKYWENDEHLVAEVVKRVDKKMKQIEKEKQQRAVEAMQEAKGDVDLMMAMQRQPAMRRRQPRRGRNIRRQRR